MALNLKLKSNETEYATKGYGLSSASVISEGTTITGDLNSKSDLRIDGEVKGNISTTAKVVIGNNGKIFGNINSQSVDIDGYVEGTIKVEDMLQLRKNCTLIGDFFAGNLLVEPTSTIKGSCTIGSTKGN